MDANGEPMIPVNDGLFRSMGANFRNLWVVAGYDPRSYNHDLGQHTGRRGGDSQVDRNCGVNPLHLRDGAGGNLGSVFIPGRSSSRQIILDLDLSDLSPSAPANVPSTRLALERLAVEEVGIRPQSYFQAP